MPLERVTDRAEQLQRRTVVRAGDGSQPVGQRVRRVRGSEVAAHDLRTGGAHGGEFILEPGDELLRARREEIGQRAARAAAEVRTRATAPDQRVQQRRVLVIEATSHGSDPRQVLHGLHYQLALNRRDELIREALDRSAVKATSEGESQNTSHPMTDRKGRPLTDRGARTRPSPSVR